MEPKKIKCLKTSYQQILVSLITLVKPLHLKKKPEEFQDIDRNPLRNIVFLKLFLNPLRNSFLSSKWIVVQFVVAIFTPVMGFNK